MESIFLAPVGKAMLSRNKRKLSGKELECMHQRNTNLVAAKTGASTLMDFHELVVNGKSLQHFVTEPVFFYCSGLSKVDLIPSSNYSNISEMSRIFSGYHRK